MQLSDSQAEPFHGSSEGAEYNGAVSFQRLRKVNTIAAIVHLVQAILMLVASLSIEKVRGFTTPLTTSFLVYNATSGGLDPATKEVGSLPIGSLVSVFLFLSAAAHFLVISPLFWETYKADLQKGINRARWYEYALSSSVMIVLIASVFGCYDIASLLLIVGCNASMNFFGLMQEELSQYRKTWSPFVFGCFAGLLPWVVVAMYFLGGGNFAQIPGFVYGILFSYLFFFNTFPINMFLQYKKIGKWADYRYGELGYVFLSLASKSLLAWLVFGGTMQPNGKN